jgi:hypothetical protein
MTGTSRARRRHLYIVEPSSYQPEVQEPPPQEPSPTPAQGPSPAVVADNEAPQQPDNADPDSADPDSAGQMDADQADLDARLAGMAVLLRCALRVMKEYEDASPSRRNRVR